MSKEPFDLLRLIAGGETVHEYHLDGRMVAWLGSRPYYCNRGRWKAVVETEVAVSDKDWWPRYYFNLDYAKAEMLDWLRAHGVAVDGGKWTEAWYDAEANRHGAKPEATP